MVVSIDPDVVTFIGRFVVVPVTVTGKKRIVKDITGASRYAAAEVSMFI